jgi:putative addiction module component (TIGR02574 family)
MTVDQLAAEALSLSAESRALLADKLVESLNADGLSKIDRLWSDEAKRRRDEVRQGRVKTIPGEEGLARARRALK